MSDVESCRGTILFLPYPSTSGTWGSSLYLCAIADECVRRGYRAVFHACQPTVAAIAEAGYPTVECEGARPRHHNGPIRDLYDVCQVLGFEDAAFWDDLVRDEIRIIESLRPVAVVSDFRLSASLSAARTGVPLVSLGAWATDPRTQARGDHSLDELARAFGRRWGRSDIETLPELVFWHADRRVATSFPEFEPELADLPGVRFTGYLNRLPARTWRPTGETWPEPLIVAYSSTAPWGTRPVIEAMAKAAADIGATLWCVTTAAQQPEQVSDSFAVMSYLPFDEVLPRADAVVFHGGQGTAMASLHYGVPCLAVPGDHYERGYNARRVEELGAGVAFDLFDLRPSRIRAAFDDLVVGPEHREAALRLRQSLRALPGAAAAVDAVEELADVSVRSR